MGGERPFFRPSGAQSRHGPVPGTGAAGAAETGWGEIYATLIAHGHRACDLGHYTERQLKLYYREAQRQERRRSAARLVDVNAGMAGGKAATDRLRDLTKDTDLES